MTITNVYTTICMQLTVHQTIFTASVNLCVNRSSWFTEYMCVKQHKQFVWSSMWNSIAIHDHWGFTCESSCETPCEVYVKICVNLHVSSMWNSFAIQWGFTCESLCETPCDVYVKICVKGFTSFHTLFTYISPCKMSHACEICVWNSCEKCVKKKCKKCENWTIFTRFVTWFFTYILLVVREKEYLKYLNQPVGSYQKRTVCLRRQTGAKYAKQK